MKCVGKKTLANRGIDGNSEIGKYDRRREKLNQRHQQQLAAVRRRLENAVGAVGDRQAPIIIFVMITRLTTALPLILLEEVMNPVRCGVKEKEQKDA